MDRNTIGFVPILSEAVKEGREVDALQFFITDADRRWLTEPLLGRLDQTLSMKLQIIGGLGKGFGELMSWQERLEARLPKPSHIIKDMISNGNEFPTDSVCLREGEPQTAITLCGHDVPLQPHGTTIGGTTIGGIRGGNGNVPPVGL